MGVEGWRGWRGQCRGLGGGRQGCSVAAPEAAASGTRSRRRSSTLQSPPKRAPSAAAHLLPRLAARLGHRAHKAGKHVVQQRAQLLRLRLAHVCAQQLVARALVHADAPHLGLHAHLRRGGRERGAGGGDRRWGWGVRCGVAPVACAAAARSMQYPGSRAAAAPGWRACQPGIRPCIVAHPPSAHHHTPCPARRAGRCRSRTCRAARARRWAARTPPRTRWPCSTPSRPRCGGGGWGGVGWGGGGGVRVKWAAGIEVGSRAGKAEAIQGCVRARVAGAARRL